MTTGNSGSDGDKGDAKAKGATGPGETDWEARYKGEQKRSAAFEAENKDLKKQTAAIGDLGTKLDSLTTKVGNFGIRLEATELTTAEAADTVAATGDNDDPDRPPRESAADKVRKSQDASNTLERQNQATNRAFNDIQRYIADIPNFNSQDPEILRASEIYRQGRDEGDQVKLDQAVSMVREVSRREPATQTPPPDAEADGKDGAGNDPPDDKSNTNDESGDPPKTPRQQNRDSGAGDGTNSKGTATGDESWKEEMGNTKNPNPLALFEAHHAEEAAAGS